MTFYVDLSWVYAMGGCLFGTTMLMGLLLIAAQAGKAKRDGK